MKVSLFAAEHGFFFSEGKEKTTPGRMSDA
jgi:hypothetical protein